MAIFYCIHGATFNGDGTTSAEATVGGGVGAFNNALTCLDGTEPVLTTAPKPYTVIFKTNHLGVNVNVPVVSGFNIAGGVSGGYLTYIFDDGTEWVGEAGVLTLTIAATFNITQNEYTQILGDDFRFSVSNNGTGGGSYKVLNNAYFDGLHLLSTSTSSSYSYYYLSFGFYSTGEHGKFKQTVSKLSNSSGHVNFMYFSGKSDVAFSYYELNLVDTAFMNSGDLRGIIETNNNPALVHFDTVVFNGVGDNLLITENTGTPGSITIDALYTDNVNYAFNTEFSNALLSVSNIKKAGVGNFDFFKRYKDIVTKFETGKFYPVLSSVLPDLSTNWSVKVEFLPSTVKGLVKPVIDVSNFYDQPSAVKTLTIEMLISTLFTSPSKDEFFVVFSYEDDTGVLRVESTLKNGGLSPSSSTWSTTNYGAVDFNAYKMELTTKHTIKTGTIIQARSYFYGDTPAGAPFNFIDPQISVT